jgi:predicted nucleic acid-binding protein
MKIETYQDFLKMKELPFKEFKEQFKFPTLSLKDAINTVIATRSHLELALSQTYGQVIDNHKKHQWLNQRLCDLLRTNTILLVQQGAAEVAKQAKEEREQLDAQLGSET